MYCKPLNVFPIARRVYLIFLDENDTPPLNGLYVKHPDPEDMYVVILPM